MALTSHSAFTSRVVRIISHLIVIPPLAHHPLRRRLGGRLNARFKTVGQGRPEIWTGGVGQKKLMERCENMMLSCWEVWGRLHIQYMLHLRLRDVEPFFVCIEG